jgi:3-(3-hydroxy-phenyl)propionate hydroxylase
LNFEFELEFKKSLKKKKMPFHYKTYSFQTPPELQGEVTKIYDAVIVGAGPVGLTLALSLAKKGIKVVVLDSKNQVSVGSRAICFAKRSLEIFDKLDVAKPMMEKGVRWNVGRIFFQENEIDRFDLSPEKLSKFPAFINLQQYYVEDFLIDAALKEPNIDLRWESKIIDFEEVKITDNQYITLNIETPEGNYFLKSKYLVACDGSRSHIRNIMNLEMEGERFEERFLIADFVMEADFPSERWFWFDPPFARRQSILLHKQPDNIWRLDFKLGKNADNALAQNQDFLKEKIKSVVGERPFELDWTSIYSFSSKMLERFVHDRVIFAGDAAHVVSPFGARGANSGVQDADNLAWKLAKILKNEASEALLETYNAERTAAAKQNIACTGQTNLFIAPPTEAATAYRNDILAKAQSDATYKRKINCGRLSVPNIYGQYPNSNEGVWKSDEIAPGHAVKDCPIHTAKTFLSEKLKDEFTLLILKDMLFEKDKKILKSHNINILEINYKRNTTLIMLYELEIDAAYFITPDQYILGRWKNFNPNKAIDLMNLYLSGKTFESETLQKSAQELIDDEVEKNIKTAIFDLKI